MTSVEATDRLVAAPLDAVEHRQLVRLRRIGTTGALLMAIGATSSYGAASPVPNPVDGLRIVGLMSRLSTSALGVSYTGMGLLVLSWLLIGRLAIADRPRRLSRSQLSHTLAMWAVPFLIVPPVFSRDAYSYLAVGSMVAHGFDPYASGPYDVLGDSNVFAHQVDARWQHTASPYGPGFILIARLIATITGQNLITALLLQRLVELIGVAAIIWAIPRLAAYCRIDPVSALWLGALNPLVLFHLIAGAHNEALMIGAMLAGLVIGLGLVPRIPARWAPIVGVAVITLGVAVKATAAMALPFLVIALALREGRGWRPLVRQAVRSGVTFVVVFAVLTVAAGFGLGWIGGLGATGTVRSFLSATTTIGVGAGFVGQLLGLGDHSDAAVAAMQPVGTVVGSVIAVALMWLSWRRRIRPITALGLALGAFVLFGPVIQPWYLLWAVLPLAAATDDRRFRLPAVWLSAGYALTVMPNGGTIPPFAIVQAVAVAAVVVIATWLWLRHHGLPQSSVDTRRFLDQTLSLRRRSGHDGPPDPA